MATLSKEEFYNQTFAPAQNWNQILYFDPGHFRSANQPDYKGFLSGKSFIFF